MESRGRLILFPLPFQGHVNPMIQLANILHSRGFTISIFHTTYNPPNSSKYPNFTFHPISDGLLSDTQDFAPDPALIIKLLNSSCVEPFRECLVKLLSESKHGQVKGIITDANWYFTQSVADSLEIPRLAMRTSSICSFLAFAALPTLEEKGYLNDRDSRMEEDVEEVPPLKVKDIPVIEVGGCNPQDARQNILKLLEQTKKASALIFNTSQELEEPDLIKLQQQFPIPTFIIGPFHKCFSAASSSFFAHDRTSISWLDTQAPKSVLYVSFGSVVTLDVHKLQEVASGLANSMQPFLWAIRPGVVHGCKWHEMFPKGFLEETSKRGHVIKWAPQQEVLHHPSVGGFWTHCGWNSTLESICEGVPMICSPVFGDQLVNSRYVNDVWKIGIRLERGFERGEIEYAIRKLMVEKEGQEMRKKGFQIKEKIDGSLSLGGPSYKALDDLVDSITSEVTSPSISKFVC